MKAMPNKNFVQKLGFLPKNGASGVFGKPYLLHDGYITEVDFESKKFNFGSKIKFDSGITQNFSQEENWVVLECVNRLLEKGYAPEDIILEKIYPTGHGTSGRLDILVKKNNKAYIMIECKTWGTEFDKEFKKLQKDGGQLFTYFQQDRDAEYLMLYTSQFDGENINYRNEIIKIEDHYREAGNVKDFYDRWNKLTKSNGVFDDWVSAYEFQSKALTRNDLKIIRQEDSGFIFNRFLEVLRQNVVSDKPNAFNKIFTLFLCKIVDEDRAKNEELHFQWLEGQDNNISFQKRLTDLYKRGMNELLAKEVTDMGDEEFQQKFGSIDEKYKAEFLKILTEIRLKKNNEFAFKEVFDDESFEENAKVVKEVVELLQGYQIRYNQKHQYLGDFFELLLTTGLKQESGQFFTPVPIAKYIIRSLPLFEMIETKTLKGNPNDLLPFIIDYAAGSGHFLTESMEEVQKIVDQVDESKFNPQSSKKFKAWKNNQFDWAFDYVYGIEKDYRLVKTAKVSCYLHGDGLAKVIHADGLGTFNKTRQYHGKLKEIDHKFPQDNKQFDLVVSNPPYSVSAFKGTLIEEDAKKSFDLFGKLTDQSSEIECLFIERTKQLLKDGGLAGVILPSSILSNAGIYTKTREILFKYFEIIAITELGSGTFMATGTNTVILFLKRRNNYEWKNIQEAVEKFFQNFKDVTVNGIENVFSKYVQHVWESVSFEDYVSLCQSNPNEVIRNNDVYKEYINNIKSKNEEEVCRLILEIEKEKLLYFILAYQQKVVIVKSGEKKEEKAFLGYEFSFRRGYEGIHAIQRSKSIDECTKMYDAINKENPQRASYYVYKAFLGKTNVEIDEAMKKHIFQINLIDMMTFGRIDFEKTISLAAKKKIKIESKWKMVRLGDIAIIDAGDGAPQGTQYFENGKTPFIRAANLNFIDGLSNLVPDKENYVNEDAVKQYKLRLFKQGTIIFPKSGQSINTNKIAFLPVDCYVVNHLATVFIEDRNLAKIIFEVLKKYGTSNLKNGDSDYPSINLSNIKDFKVPLPPLNIQKKIVVEIEQLEQKESKAREEIKKLKDNIASKFATSSTNKYEVKKLGEVCEMKAGDFVKVGDISDSFQDGLYPCYGANGLRGYTKTYTHEGMYSLVGRQGALCGNVHLVNGKFHATEHALVVIPKLKVDTIWLYHKLVIMNLNQYATGTAQPGLSVMNLTPIEVLLPPFFEQEKIVAEIEVLEHQISSLNMELEKLKKDRREILKKYL